MSEVLQFDTLYSTELQPTSCSVAKKSDDYILKSSLIQLPSFSLNLSSAYFHIIFTVTENYVIRQRLVLRLIFLSLARKQVRQHTLQRPLSA
jgi:hypothetical protein